MRKFLLALGILLVPAFCHADKKPIVFGRMMPDAETFVSQAVYITSDTCAGGYNILISSRASYLFAVNVTTISGTGGWAQAYDSKSSGGGRVLTSTTQTTSLASWMWNVGASSGIYINNIGGACLGVVYYEQ